MGAIAYDINKKERDFKSLNLSDENVVKYLLLYRSKVDTLYKVNVNIDIGQAGETFEFNQELVALYSSLDITIEKCNFKEKHIKLLNLIYEGNTLQDIIAMKIGYTKSATYELFDRMINKIVRVNNEIWKISMEKRGYKKC